MLHSQHVHELHSHESVHTHTQPHTHEYKSVHTLVHTSLQISSYVNMHQYSAVQICTFHLQHVDDAHEYEFIPISIQSHIHQNTSVHTSVHTVVHTSAHICTHMRTY